MTERLHERRPMATSTLISFAGVVLAFVVFGWGLISTYGAEQRHAGASEAINKILAGQVKDLTSQNAAQDISIAVLRSELESAKKDLAESKASADALVREIRYKEEQDHEREIRELQGSGRR